jgi:hypothetical protein
MFAGGIRPPDIRTSMPRLIPAALLLAGLATGTGAAALAADPIPQNMLDNSHKSCMQSCTGSGQAQGKCTAYCNCTVDSIEEQFSGEEFAAMNQSAVPGQPLVSQPIDPGSRDKLTAIVNDCRAKTLQ